LIAYDIKFAREGHPEALRHICLLAAVLLERGDPLPEPLGTFIAEYLRNPIKPKPRERYRELVVRAELIGLSIMTITHDWGFRATRNIEATERASAASIVRQALKKGAGVSLGEKAINKIWETSHGARLARAGQGDFRRLRLKHPDKSLAETVLMIIKLKEQ